MSSRRKRLSRPLGRCGKVILHTELEAKWVFSQMVRRDKEPERWYECNICPAGTWHITSQDQRSEPILDILRDVASGNEPLIASTHHLTEGAAA